MMSEKEIAYKKHLKENELSDLSSIREDFEAGFDAGVNAERERIKKMISSWRERIPERAIFKLSEKRLAELFPNEGGEA